MSADDSMKKRAESIQQHGGLKMPVTGGVLEQHGPAIGGAIGAAIPKVNAGTRATTSLFGSFLGKGLQSMGTALKTGLPVDRPQYDIMRDMGASHSEALRQLANKK